jgi:hypothetical protein
MTLTPEDIAAGWVEWGGGRTYDSPVKCILIDVRFKDGMESQSLAAEYLCWDHIQHPSDIIAYRIIQPAPENEEAPE